MEEVGERSPRDVCGGGREDEKGGKAVAAVVPDTTGVRITYSKSLISS